MKLVIDIPEEEYNKIEPLLNGETIKGGFNGFRALEIIKNGTPLPFLLVISYKLGSMDVEYLT